MSNDVFKIVPVPMKQHWGVWVDSSPESPLHYAINVTIDHAMLYETKQVLCKDIKNNFSVIHNDTHKQPYQKRSFNGGLWKLMERYKLELIMHT